MRQQAFERIFPILLLLLVSLAGCQSKERSHDHSEDHPKGHDHHQSGHGHGNVPIVGTTLWSDNFELFAEHNAVAAGEQISFLLHLTHLPSFLPLEETTVELEFSGPTALRATTSKALRPGIFSLELTPEKAGVYRGRLLVNGPKSGVVDGIELRVAEAGGHGHHHESHIETEGHHDEGLIEFLKEQQWGVPFGTAFVKTGSVVPSIVVSGLVDTPPGGKAVVGAPVTGRLVSPAAGLPRPGTQVRKGQVLASLVPAASPEAAARSNLAVAEAEARLSAATLSAKRAERLFQDEAISKRELEDAHREQTVAQEAVSAARRGAQLFSSVRGTGTNHSGTWQLTAPISGTLVAVHATPGATVSPGETLFRILNRDELWVVARVPEQDAGRLMENKNASYKVAGESDWRPLSVVGESANASVVTIGAAVDSTSRTVEAIYSLHAPPTVLRVGGLLQVSVPAGDAFEGAVIPRSALIDREGRTVVYVQVDGEHFEERTVRMGPQAGNWVATLQGLKVGERIVTRGAHLVRLVEQAAGAPAHGHIH